MGIAEISLAYTYTAGPTLLWNYGMARVVNVAIENHWES
jgi:hypothetical protein